MQLCMNFHTTILNKLKTVNAKKLFEVNPKSIELG